MGVKDSASGRSFARADPVPDVEANGGPWSDYFYNNYLNAPNDNPKASNPALPDRKLTMVATNDGTSNTVFIGHGNYQLFPVHVERQRHRLQQHLFVGGTLGTMHLGPTSASNPAGVSLKRTNSSDAPGVGSWGGPFPQGGLMGMGDGTVRMFPYTMLNAGAFLTPNGGEVVMLPDT